MYPLHFAFTSKSLNINMMGFKMKATKQIDG
jgi:hypothetical protein